MTNHSVEEFKTADKQSKQRIGKRYLILDLSSSKSTTKVWQKNNKWLSRKDLKKHSKNTSKDWSELSDKWRQDKEK